MSKQISCRYRTRLKQEVNEECKTWNMHQLSKEKDHMLSIYRRNANRLPTTFSKAGHKLKQVAQVTSWFTTWRGL